MYSHANFHDDPLIHSHDNNVVENVTMGLQFSGALMCQLKYIPVVFKNWIIQIPCLYSPAGNNQAALTYQYRYYEETMNFATGAYSTSGIALFSMNYL